MQNTTVIRVVITHIATIAVLLVNSTVEPGFAVGGGLEANLSVRTEFEPSGTSKTLVFEFVEFCAIRVLVQSDGGTIIRIQVQNVVFVTLDTNGVFVGRVFFTVKNGVGISYAGDVNASSAILVRHLALRTGSLDDFAFVFIFVQIETLFAVETVSIFVVGDAI